jgi:hypothetical protein
VLYNHDNEVKADSGENLVRLTFDLHGYSVKPHDIYDPGCDGVFSGNNISLGCYEVNYWKPGTYFSDDRITSIDCNLYEGYEWDCENDQYVKHGDSNVQIRFHFSFGAIRDEYQQNCAKKLDIIYIHTVTLPTPDELWSIISPYFQENPNLKFYKVVCIGHTHLDNDRTSMMVLVTPIVPSSINNIQALTSKITSKIKLKGKILGINSSFGARFSKSQSSGLPTISDGVNE